MSGTVAKRYPDPEEFIKYEKSKDDDKKLPFYDTVRKNIAGFDVGFRSYKQKLRAIGFESWYGVGNGWVAAFRNRFETKSQGNRKLNRDGAVNMNEKSSGIPRVGKVDKPTNANSNSNNCDAKAEINRMNEIFGSSELIVDHNESIGNISLGEGQSHKYDANTAKLSDPVNKTNGFNQQLVESFTSTLQTILKVIPNMKKKRHEKLNGEQDNSANKNCIDMKSKVQANGDNKILNSCSPVIESINLDEIKNVRLVRKGAKRCEKDNGTVSVGVGLVLFPPWLTHSTQLIRW
ncbi:hypothetical protein CHUAL_014125 [Chamberlinius hualienensis]